VTGSDGRGGAPVALAPGPYVPPAGSIPTLDVPDLSAVRTIHMVGVGGAGMCGLARILIARGIGVSGSDLKAGTNTEALTRAGAAIAVGPHRPENLRLAGPGPDVVVISSAIRADNSEVVAARAGSIPVLARAQLLAALMRGSRGIAVAGTHGKTTVTSMIAVMLGRLGLDPTFVIGGDLNESGSGALHGDGDLFVAEADESDGSFLLLDPEVSVITNVEEDHLDFYDGRGDIESAFAAFACSSGGVVACWDDPGTQRAVAGVDPARLLRYGSGPDADLVLLGEELEPGGARAVVRSRGEETEVRLCVPGRHNLLNAVAALGVATMVGAPLAPAAAALASFTGVRRRFEDRGDARGARFVDDYAHHPTELAATLATARAAPGRRVVAVFQPHRYTRTEAMWQALGESLAAADVVVLTEVYPAGEPPIPGVSAKLVVEALTEACPGKRVVYLPSRRDVAPFLASEVRDGDLVITLGAGDITTVGEETIERIREAAR
jgi:UDP-N-acetylmuramate--alanine ligase